MIQHISIRKYSLITFFLTLLLLLITLLPAGAAVNPAWFTITQSQSSWLAEGSYRIPWTGATGLYLGHLGIGRNNSNPYPNDYQWQVQFRFSNPNNLVRLTKVGDPTKFFDISLLLAFKNKNYTVNSSPQVITGIVDSSPIDTNLNVNIAGRSGSDAGYTGTYTGSFKVQIFVRDPDPPYEMVQIAEQVHNILAWYNVKYESPIEDPIYSYLILDRYANADSIDVDYLKNNNLSLLVGAVTLLTNDSNTSHSYTINVVPTHKNGQPKQGGNFAFYHQNGNNEAFKYRVFVNGRTQPSQGAFSVQAPAIGPAEFWQDWVELGISGLNYTNEIIGSGNHSSTIRIELTTNY